MGRLGLSQSGEPPELSLNDILTVSGRTSDTFGALPTADVFNLKHFVSFIIYSVFTVLFRWVPWTNDLF